MLFGMLGFLGIERAGARVGWISAAEGSKFAATMREFAEQVAALGKGNHLGELR